SAALRWGEGVHVRTSSLWWLAGARTVLNRPVTLSTLSATIPKGSPTGEDGRPPNSARQTGSTRAENLSLPRGPGWEDPCAQGQNLETFDPLPDARGQVCEACIPTVYSALRARACGPCEPTGGTPACARP